MKKGILRNFAKFTVKHLCQSLFFNKVTGGACNFIKKETLAQVFSCEVCEISKNTFYYRTPLVAAFGGACDRACVRTCFSFRLWRGLLLAKRQAITINGREESSDRVCD